MYVRKGGDCHDLLQRTQNAGLAMTVDEVDTASSLEGGSAQNAATLRPYGAGGFQGKRVRMQALLLITLTQPLPGRERNSYDVRDQ